MNWAAGLYTAALWILAAACWMTLRRSPRPASNTWLTITLVRDVVPGILLGILMARLI